MSDWILVIFFAADVVTGSAAIKMPMADAAACIVAAEELPAYETVASAFCINSKTGAVRGPYDKKSAAGNAP